MIKPAIDYINSKLASLNYFEKSYGLCEVITKGEKRFPAEYISKGEYKQINNFDKYNGVSYLRKNGDINISEADNTLQACGILSSVGVPLRLVVIVPRSQLDCDDNYAEDVMAQAIMKEIVITGGDLKVSLSARQAKLTVDSYSTDSLSILSEEYSNYGKKDINYKFAYLALDLTVNALITQDCLTDPCYYMVTNSSTDCECDTIVQAGVTAYALGGQANATELPTISNGEANYRVDTVASDLGSVKPSSPIRKKMSMLVLNRAGNGNSINYYPPSGGRFRIDSGLMAVDAPLPIADGNQIYWKSYEDNVMTLQ